MGPAGLAAFLADLGCGEDDLIGIVVAWKLGARRLGRVTRTEFVQGLTALNCDSIAAIKAILPRLEAQLKDRSVARDLFSYAWQVAKVGLFFSPPPPTNHLHLLPSLFLTLAHSINIRAGSVEQDAGSA